MIKRLYFELFVLHLRFGLQWNLLWGHWVDMLSEPLVNRLHGFSTGCGAVFRRCSPFRAG